MIRLIVACVTLFKTLICLPFSLFGIVCTYVKKMGCGDSKPDIVFYWENMVNDGIINIKTLRNLLTNYLMRNSDGNYQHTARRIIEVFYSLDNFVITAKKFALKQLPTQCPSRRILHDQINQTEQLSQSQQDTHYLINQNSHFNKELHDYEIKIKNLEEINAKNEKDIQILLWENQVLKNKLQEAKNNAKVQNKFDISTNNEAKQIQNDAASTAKPDEVTSKSDQRKSVLGEAADPYVIKSLARIEDISNEVHHLKIKVNNFIGTKDDKNFLHIRELLMRYAVKLDDIETEGHLIIREKRREVIRRIQQTVEDLNRKVDV